MTRDEIINALKTTKKIFEGHVKTDRITPDIDYKPLYEQIMNQIIFITLHHERFNDLELEDFFHSICQPALTIKDLRKPHRDREEIFNLVSQLVQTKGEFLESVYGMNAEDLHYIHEMSSEAEIHPEAVPYNNAHFEFPKVDIKLESSTVNPPKWTGQEITNGGEYNHNFDIKTEFNNLQSILNDCSLSFIVNRRKVDRFDHDNELEDLYNDVRHWADESIAEAQRNIDNNENNEYYAKMLHNSAYASFQMQMVLQAFGESIYKQRVQNLKNTLKQLEEHYGQKDKTM